eukprot:1344992-Pyramimonas_sp.AAC.1
MWQNRATPAWTCTVRRADRPACGCLLRQAQTPESTDRPAMLPGERRRPARRHCGRRRLGQTPGATLRDYLGRQGHEGEAIARSGVADVLAGVGAGSRVAHGEVHCPIAVVMPPATA